MLHANLYSVILCFHTPLRGVLNHISSIHYKTQPIVYIEREGGRGEGEGIKPPVRCFIIAAAQPESETTKVCAI